MDELIPKEKSVFWIPLVTRLLKKSGKKNGRTTSYSYGCMSIIRSINVLIRMVTNGDLLYMVVNNMYYEHDESYLDLEEKLSNPIFCVDVLYESTKGGCCCNYLIKLKSTNTGNEYYLYFKTLIIYPNSKSTLFSCPLCNKNVEHIDTHLVKNHNESVLTVCLFCLLTNIYYNIPLKYIIATTLKNEDHGVKRKKIDICDSFNKKTISHVKGFHFFLTDKTTYVDITKNVLRKVQANEVKTIHKLKDGSYFVIPKTIFTGSSRILYLPWLNLHTTDALESLNYQLVSMFTENVPKICKENEEVDVNSCFGVSSINEPTVMIVEPSKQLFIEIDYDSYRHLNLLKYKFYTE